MPTYDYQCQACGHEFEEFQSMSASSLRKCPECKKLKLKRLIGIGAAVIFKGSGFWETDYRSEGYKKDAAADKKAGKEAKEASSKSDSGKSVSGKDSAKKSESKPAKSDSGAGGKKSSKKKDK